MKLQENIPLLLQAPLSWSSSRVRTACSRPNNHDSSASLVVKPPAREPFAAMSTRPEACATYRGGYQPCHNSIPCLLHRGHSDEEHNLKART